MNIKSPLTGSNNIIFKNEISCNFIIKNYEKLNINVSKYFQKLKNIQIYQCNDTGLNFYYPFNITGDEEFYEKLQEFPWYYMDWKWEHKKANNLIKKTDKILEIGCGNGGFLQNMQKRGIENIGLEFNKTAIKVCQTKGLNIFKQSVQEHAKNTKNKYNVVCSFQVLEHINITKIKSFLQASINMLEPNGKLIISVPNNYPDSLMTKNNILNMPPHHTSLWSTESLISLQNILPIKLEKLEIEPLQKYHFNSYTNNTQNMIRKKYGLCGRIINKVSNKLITEIVQNLSNNIIGHTILVQYKKNETKYPSNRNS